MTQIREHRGGLAESMATVRTVADRAELLKVVRESFAVFSVSGIHVEPDMLIVEPYAKDERIGWDTYLISVKGYGVWGMSDGPI